MDSYDYSNTQFSDFEFHCPDGTLRFSKYLLAKQPYWSKAIGFGGRETTSGVFQTPFSKAVMNCLLNYMDPINGVRVLSGDIVELAKAAHLYQVSAALWDCHQRVVDAPECRFLELTEHIFADLNESLLTVLLETGRLTNVSEEMYLHLFRNYDPRRVAPLFLRDGHRYSDRIEIQYRFLQPADYTDLARQFDSPAATTRLLAACADALQQHSGPKKRRLDDT